MAKENNVKKGKEWQASTKQMQMVEVMLDFEKKRTKEEMCKEVDITPKTFWQWRKDERFNNYVQKQIDKIVKSEVSGVWQALINNAQKGDTSAIKLFFELIGEYKDRKELTGKDGAPIETKANIQFYLPNNGRE